MSISLLDWKPMNRNSLRGFASVRYGSLKISDVTVHNANGRKWANLPSKPHVKDGVQVTGADGKARWTPILEWTSKDAADKFSEAVIGAIEIDNPGATEA